MSGLIADEFRTARKEHMCFLCGEKILKGEKYRRSTFFDGEMITNTEHKKCFDILGDLGYAFLMDLSEYTYDEFREAVSEMCRYEICPMCPKYDKESKGCSENNTPYQNCMPRIWEWAETHHYNRKTSKWEKVK